MEKTYKLIGLAKKAGRVVCGETKVKLAISDGSAYVVIIADDVSKNAYKSITNSCKYYDVKYFTVGDMETLGHSVGNNFNATVAVTDEGLGNLIIDSIKKYEGGAK